MITDVEAVLQDGQYWPPDGEIARLTRYERESSLFRGNHGDIFKDVLRKLSGDRKDELRMIVNFPKRISTLWADLVLIEAPDVVGADAISDYLPMLWSTVYQAIIDMSRHGVAVMKIDRVDGGAEFRMVPVRYWFPVVEPDNMLETIGHIFAYTFRDGPAQYLRAEIHTEDKIEYRTYNMTGSLSGRLMVAGSAAVEYPWSVVDGDESRVYVLHNMQSSEDILGISDYADIESIVGEIEIRYSQIARILDANAAPSMEGPASALQRNPITGEQVFKGGGRYIAREPNQPETRMIEWGGNLEGAFTELEKLRNDLFTISETCAEAFGQGVGQSGPLSGTAIRLRLLAPLAKASRIKMFMTPRVLAMLRHVGHVIGAPVSGLVIKWKDGLPDDPIETMASLLPAYVAGGMSLETFIRATQCLGPDEVVEEIARIGAGSSEPTGREPLVLPPEVEL